MRLPQTSRFHYSLIRVPLLHELLTRALSGFAPPAGERTAVGAAAWTAVEIAQAGALIETWGDRIWTPPDFRSAVHKLILASAPPSDPSKSEATKLAAGGDTKRPTHIVRNGVSIALVANGGVLPSTEPCDSTSGDAAMAAALAAAEEATRARVAEHVARGTDFMNERKRERKLLHLSPDQYLAAPSVGEYEAPASVYGTESRSRAVVGGGVLPIEPHKAGEQLEPVRMGDADVAEAEAALSSLFRLITATESESSAAVGSASCGWNDGPMCCGVALPTSDGDGGKAEAVASADERAVARKCAQILVRVRRAGGGGGGDVRLDALAVRLRSALVGFSRLFPGHGVGEVAEALAGVKEKPAAEKAGGGEAKV
jgi:hypothetical protein